MAKIPQNNYIKDDQRNFASKHPTQWQSDLGKNNTNFSVTKAKKYYFILNSKVIVSLTSTWSKKLFGKTSSQPVEQKTF